MLKDSTTLSQISKVFPLCGLLLQAVTIVAIAMTGPASFSQQGSHDKTIDHSTTTISSAVAYYAKGNFQEARAAFEYMLTKEPDNGLVLYNLGLTEFKMGNAGKALGLWRKAVSIIPNFPDARNAIRFALVANPNMQSYAEGSPREWFYDHVVAYFSKDFILFLISLSFLFVGWSLIKFLGKRKRAYDNDSPTPIFGWTQILSTLLFCGAVTIGIFKVSEDSRIRATVIAKKAEAKSAPAGDAATLFEVPEGSELLIKRGESGWAQVLSNGGRVGWVPAEQLYVSSGVVEW